MNLLSDMLYWLSTGMLVPVVLLLLAAFGGVLLIAGDLLSLYLSRLRALRQVTHVLDTATPENVRGQDWNMLLPAYAPLRTRLLAAQERQWTPLQCERILSDFEFACRRDVETALILLRIGPMLGLMGTLIPMGPALVGLAAGDLATMASSIQVAFSTTVVGIFIGGLGFLAHLLKRRWYAQDLQHLSHLFALAGEAGSGSEAQHG